MPTAEDVQLLRVLLRKLDESGHQQKPVSKEELDLVTACMTQVDLVEAQMKVCTETHTQLQQTQEAVC